MASSDAPSAAAETSAQRWLTDRWPSVQDLDRRHPWLLDSAVAAAIALLALPGVISNGRIHHHAVLYWAAAAVLLVPLWWRRRAPGLAFIAVATLLLVEWSLGFWIGTGLGLLVVLNGVAIRSSIAMVTGAAAATGALLVYAVAVLQPSTEHPLTTLLLLLGTSTAAVAIGLTVRMRRAYLSALEDRAARLETERDQRTLLAAAAERARVAREMHDIVGHHVSVMVGLADGSAALATDRGEPSAEPLRLIAETGRQALGELRRVLGVLRDGRLEPQLNPQPGIQDLDRMVHAVRAAGLTVTCRTSGDLQRLGPGLQLTVYRIVQEALTNTLKHAGPGATADVTVAAGEDKVRVRVTDSGPAGPHIAPTEAARQGIVGIRERAGLYGGVVTAGPATADDGWILDVVLTDPAAVPRRETDRG